MAHITKIAVVETTTAIWEYNPSLPDNRMLNGNLDVIAAIRMLVSPARDKDSKSRVRALSRVCDA